MREPSFSRSDLEGLKVAIFRSLENYPRESVTKLVDLGLRSRNEEIHALSKNFSWLSILAKRRENDQCLKKSLNSSQTV